MPRESLYFTAPETVEVREEPIPEPASHEVRVRATYSAISPGTEGLVYRGEWAADDNDDAELDPISAHLAYPVRYGYSLVGVVEAMGPEVTDAWQGQRVFALAPHSSHYCCDPAELIVLPDDIDDRDAAFLANMETAVNFVLDAQPKMGERALVLGQGVVGLLLTGCLAQFPLEALVTAELDPQRREMSAQLGAHASLDPRDPEHERRLSQMTGSDSRAVSEPSGADLIVELTGNPDALNRALAHAGYETRIVVGSWYGAKSAELALGGAFHRQRVRMTSSQVSTLAPALRGRWTHARRMAVALEALRTVRPSRLVTDVLPLREAERAYRRLVAPPEGVLQMLFSYNDIPT